MKKNFLLLSLFFLFVFIKANSQTPDWVWARSATDGSTGLGIGTSVVTDISGNVYVTGGFRDTITFGSYTFNNVDGVFLTKYDSLGNVLWTKEGIGNGDAFGVAIDGLGNVYLTGSFINDSISFGSYTLTSIGSQNIFLVKYDSSGNVLWAKSAEGMMDDNGSCVSTDVLGNIYITGHFGTPSITFGSYTLNSAGGFDVFLAKYDSSGNVLWAKRAGGMDDDNSFGVATDALGNVYITGYFSSDSIAFGSYTLSNAGMENVFLAKYDSSGNVLWAKSAGGIDNDASSGISADASRNIYVTGYFTSPSISFGSYTLTNSGNENVFIAKYNSSGNVLWAKSAGGSSYDGGYSIATDNFGKVYLTGGFDSDSIKFDTITLIYPTGATDPMLVAGYDSSGHVLFAKPLASGGISQNAVAVSRSGSIYICGDFKSVNPFIVGKDSLYRFGEENVFVAKLGYPKIGESVSEIIPAKDFILYPNPFDGKLNVASPPNPLSKGEGEEEEFVLYDVTGRLLLRCLFTTSATINTEQLASGLYIYEIEDKDGVGARGKAVKQ